MAPVSRPLASSANSSIQKYSANRIQLPIVLDFQSDKGKEAITKWYHKQPTTLFTYLEHRKETTGRFRHEFIVAYLSNNTACRFDRRAREDMRGHALKDEGTISEDSAHVITKADTESKARLKESEVLMGLSIRTGQDLDFILAVCYAIQSHPEAKSYSLLHYNCYFFSWTLIAIIGHHTHHRRVQEDYWERSAGTWMTGFSGVLARGVAVTGSYRQEQPFWGRFTRFGRSSIGATWHQESLTLPVNHYIREGMNKELGDYFRKTPYLALGRILFPSQISPLLKRKVSLALQKGGRRGVQQFLAKTNAQSQTNSKLFTPIHPGKMRFGETNRLYGNTSSLANLDHTYHSMEKRAQSQAEAEQMRYDEAIDTFIAHSIHLRNWSNEYWSRKSAVHHVTRRMVDHFKQVEEFGFGKAERSIKRAEDTMVEIWVSVLHKSIMNDESEDESELHS
ncbi:unnamed protein product [Rhizoctonia solani]|uniref:Uncharacterized protein n=1 Tax=Rhizoctonia solani TaxID=456999 RepID=A0A8H2XVY5_9AGAM|nr:unnamed protein product [Rhizoctonia solani]